MSERSRGDASDIDGKTERSKWAGAHESTRATSEFQLGRNRGRRLRPPEAGCARCDTGAGASGTLISNVRKSGARSITSLAADLNMFSRFVTTDATSTR